MSNRQEVNAERTRADLIGAATLLFGTNGYRSVSIDDLCSEVGLSRGGFYHHFDSKQDCFEAVWIKLQEDFAHASAAHYATVENLESWDQVRSGFLHLFDFWAEPHRRRINLLDASMALGWERIRNLSDGHGTKAVMDLLDALGRQADPMTAQLVSAAIGEAVFHAGDPNNSHDRELAANTLVTLIAGLPLHNQPL